jgi:hypothetical protein
VKIIGKAYINNSKVPCYGEIEIHSVNEKQAYVTWRISTQKSLLAAVTSDYYIENDKISIDEILKRVIDSILKYRIGRKRIFSEISFSAESPLREG